ncbi:hypothetical protein [Thiobacillus denitrificans]|uniref:hypothetical protein n=1 Tax=Thiobacillus denitrificans TaxID=36861 RepID=UPI001EE44B70|nr:hypothetical protein [Thiobacillus denitrificans]
MKRPATFAALVLFTAATHAASETYVIDAHRTSSLFSYRSLGFVTRARTASKESAAHSSSTVPRAPVAPTCGSTSPRSIRGLRP